MLSFIDSFVTDNDHHVRVISAGDGGPVTLQIELARAHRSYGLRLSTDDAAQLHDALEASAGLRPAVDWPLRRTRHGAAVYSVATTGQHTALRVQQSLTAPDTVWVFPERDGCDAIGQAVNALNLEQAAQLRDGLRSFLAADHGGVLQQMPTAGRR